MGSLTSSVENIVFRAYQWIDYENIIYKIRKYFYLQQKHIYT